MAAEPPTFRAFVSAWTDFLNVVTHTILYERQIYPRSSFISARKYNFAVRQSRHPKVCEWITDAVTAVESEMLKGTADQVAIVIFSKHHNPLERYVFDVSQFPIVPQSELDVPLRRVAIDGSNATILPMVDLEEQLRATMSRLSNCSSTLRDLPLECTFTIVMELKGEDNAPVGYPQLWVPSERQSDHVDNSQDTEKSTTPVRSVRAGDMIFETWIEQLDIPDDNSDLPGSTG